jgi:hypothetical protein
MRTGLRAVLGKVRGARRASGEKESFWGPGKDPPEERNGLLFNETPPPPGQSRKWELWELPW